MGNPVVEDVHQVALERIDEAGMILNDSKYPLAARFRALFLLRSVKDDKSVQWICKCFVDPSALLKHELAYCLGQMQNPSAIPCLIAVLEDTNQEPMVRHEAGEALGAIGDPLDEHNVYAVLERHINDPTLEVAETCQLAIQRIQWIKANLDSTSNYKSIYDSIDPAPPVEADLANIQELSAKLVDSKRTLWERYRAMFALRNLNTDQATKALAQGLLSEDSALFRHEIAYVLGQIQSEVAIPELKARLQMKEENGMVRHECAEALGSIGTAECQLLLKNYLEDEERVVRESCEVALDIAEWSRQHSN